ncbi:PDDEXK family nuclease [Thermogemmatispora tikiterensis]|uniref:Restriction endonuclease n=1 Tax=Thermogemmatispora tikiterensis TaxID=1825093 RepID=A0A328VNW3_9CHLR|nr:hypothetical protein [Thermogemmatispora tikiterensis]RAQ96834.1 hypothetical protein A4R35_14950 [Thermogemmatispora tikiterensis]
MKIVKSKILIDKGGFSSLPSWQRIRSDVLQAIASIQWPPGSGAFVLYDELGKRRGEGNGVKPIKDACMLYLREQGWLLEYDLGLPGIGKVDAVYLVDGKQFALEWETGNISSSHRSLNKMALAMLKGTLIGGVLILPSRIMYRYLTDRIGNFEEITPYFPLWEALGTFVNIGILWVIAIEQDAVSKSVPRIEKGRDGRALM